MNNANFIGCEQAYERWKLASVLGNGGMIYELEIDHEPTGEFQAVFQGSPLGGPSSFASARNRIEKSYNAILRKSQKAPECSLTRVVNITGA